MRTSQNIRHSCLAKLLRAAVLHSAFVRLRAARSKLDLSSIGSTLLRTATDSVLRDGRRLGASLTGILISRVPSLLMVTSSTVDGLGSIQAHGRHS